MQLHQPVDLRAFCFYDITVILDTRAQLLSAYQQIMLDLRHLRRMQQGIGLFRPYMGIIQRIIV